MIRVGLVQCQAHEGLGRAVAAHPRLDLVNAYSVDQQIDCDVVLAVDDEPAVAHNDVRRYLTRDAGRHPDVVACRHQLIDRPASVVAPLPVVAAVFRRPEACRVLVVGTEASSVRDILQRAGFDVVDGLGADTAVLVDTSAEASDVGVLRRAMAAEMVVIGLASNPVIADTIRPGSDGIVIEDLAGCVGAVSMLLRAPAEIARLGFEARCAVAAATWSRVLRALIARPLSESPRLDGLGVAAAGVSWRSRLALAAPWTQAHLVEGTIIELLRDGAPIRHDLGPMSKLRIRGLHRAMGMIDVDS